jgi:DNA (cytosine-5)-methyltransferase 1
VRYLSVCSGIEAASVAWHPLGWQPAAFSEIEPFPSAVLAHHYPNVPNLGDMTKFKEWEIGAIDLLVGGTPCQSFSVAGLRKGLEDPRGNLALVYCGILDRFKPKWFIWENVPGVLSSSGGRDFGSFLGAVAELGYGFAYRVLDAQYFGVAQRRRRVFVVGCLGDWRSAAAVLFEPHSLSGNPAPSREKGQKVAPAVSTGSPFSRTGNERVECDAIIPVSDPAYCLETTCNDYSRADGFNMIATPIALAENTIGRQPQNGGNGDGFTVGGPMYTLNATGVHGVAQAIPLDLRNAGRDSEKYDKINRQGVGVGEPGDPAHTLTTACVHGVAQPIPYGVGESPDTAHCLRSGASKADKHESTTYIAQPMVLMDQGGSVMNVLQDGTVGTLRRETHGHEPVVMHPTFALDEYNQSGHKEVCYPLRTASGDGIPKVNVAQPIAFTTEQTPKFNENQALTLTKSEAKHNQSVLTEMAVRRLTPTECERLQGFDDGYTNIPWRKQPESPDGPRYKALGNSMAVPVMKWIGKRIQQMENV